MLTVVTLTHPGAVRATNEDVVLWDATLGLVAVADGMGGHSAGEVAARLAIDALQASLRSTEAVSGQEAGTSDKAIANRLRVAMAAANREVFTKSHESPELAGMGTTLTAALVRDTRVWFSSVGDSRLYSKFASGEPLRQLTRDDSVADLLRNAPGVKPVALVDHQMRHLLTSAIGPRAEVDIKVEQTKLAENALLILTSDGMHGPVGDEVIDAILDGHEGMDLDIAAAHLLDAALGAGGRDNITVALARFTSAA